MDISEAKKIIHAGLAWDNWTDEQKEAMKVVLQSILYVEELREKISGLEQELKAYSKIQGLDVYTNGFAELIFSDGETMLINNVHVHHSELAVWAQKDFGIKRGKGDI